MGPLNVGYESCLALSRALQAADGGSVSVLSRAKVVGHGVIDVGGDRKAAALSRGLVSPYSAYLSTSRFRNRRTRCRRSRRRVGLHI